MPIYEYECLDCGKHFEIFQKISDKPLTECKLCKGRLNKLISNCAFHLKGNGWYVTDYKKPVDAVHGKNGGKQSETKESATETPSESKTETKTAMKTETKAEHKSAAATGGES